MSNLSGYKKYLGDAVYADFDGYNVVLTTENGIEQTNVIVLEPLVISRLKEYFERVEE